MCDKHKFNDARTRINHTTNANTFGYLMFKLFLLFHLPSNVVSILRVNPAPASFTIFLSAVEMQDVSKRSPNTIGSPSYKGYKDLHGNDRQF